MKILGNFTSEQILGFRVSRELDNYAARIIQTQIKYPELTDKRRFNSLEAAKKSCLESILALIKKGGF